MSAISVMKERSRPTFKIKEGEFGDLLERVKTVNLDGLTVEIVDKLFADISAFLPRMSMEQTAQLEEVFEQKFTGLLPSRTKSSADGQE